MCSSIQGRRNGRLICFNDCTEQCGPFLTSPAWMVVCASGMLCQPWDPAQAAAQDLNRNDKHS